MNTHVARHDPLRAAENLIRESLTSTKELALDEIVRHAANDALALAWTTPYPLLFLPVLLEEKLAAARRYSERQQFVRCWSLELVERMGWQDATAAGGSSAEADRMPPLSLGGRYSSAVSRPVMACVG
jgi:hypothetical protein